MNLIELYLNTIIIPLEKIVDAERKKIQKKRISLTRKRDKEYLLKLENLLLIYYQKYAKFIENELNYK